jgi:hypothetical protein
MGASSSRTCWSGALTNKVSVEDNAMTRSTIAVAVIAASLCAVSTAQAAGPAHEIGHALTRHGTVPAAKGSSTRLRVWFQSIPTGAGRGVVRGFRRR